MEGAQKDGFRYAGAYPLLLARDGIAEGIIDSFARRDAMESFGVFVALGEAIGAIGAATDR